MIFSTMKKTKLLLALCAIALTGCENLTINAQPQQRVENRQPQNNPRMGRIYFEGHYYIKYDGGGRISSPSITHDPDCTCRVKGEHK